MIDRNAVVIVLAAGLGKRMRSARPKVLHEVAGRPMIGHVLDAARAAGIDRRIIVVGPGMGSVAAAGPDSGETRLAVQAERRGTGHAVLTARPLVDGDAGSVFVLYGDTPLIRAETIAAMAEALSGADLVVLGFRPSDPTGYGRLVTDGTGRLVAIREHADASDAERGIDLCFSGLMAFREARTLALLDELRPDNTQGEYYLTDIVAIARAKGLAVATAETDPIDVSGVNSRAELARAEAHMQARLRAHAMAHGATLIAPETVFLSFDTTLGRDVVIEPHVVFGPGVSVGDDVVIRAYSHLEGAHVEVGARIGPFARLRPGAEVGAAAHVGNFVELKNANLGPGAKVNHLTYIGDATVGEAANIGAGTITCNYDGFAKHRTEIGARAFIGSNSALVAPVTIGEGAYVGSGSVITRSVEPDALAVGRGKQVDKPGWAARFRALHARAKERIANR